MQEQHQDATLRARSSCSQLDRIHGQTESRSDNPKNKGSTHLEILTYALTAGAMNSWHRARAAHLLQTQIAEVRVSDPPWVFSQGGDPTSGSVRANKYVCHVASHPGFHCWLSARISRQQPRAFPRPKLSSSAANVRIRLAPVRVFAPRVQCSGCHAMHHFSSAAEPLAGVFLPLVRPRGIGPSP